MVTLTMGAALAAIAAGGTPQPAVADARNAVLVHGALPDAANWRAVSDILVADGFTVSGVQLPLSSLADDVAESSASSASRTARWCSSAGATAAPS